MESMNWWEAPSASSSLHNPQHSPPSLAAPFCNRNFQITLESLPSLIIHPPSVFLSHSHSHSHSRSFSSPHRYLPSHPPSSPLAFVSPCSNRWPIWSRRGDFRRARPRRSSAWTPPPRSSFPPPYCRQVSPPRPLRAGSTSLAPSEPGPPTIQLLAGYELSWPCLFCSGRERDAIFRWREGFGGVPWSGFNLPSLEERGSLLIVIVFFFPAEKEQFPWEA